MIFRFANPFALLLLILPAVYFVVVAGFPNLRAAIPVLRYSDTRLLGDGRSWRVRLRRLPDVLRMLAWILIVFVIARPQSGREQEVIRGQGIDIVLALDISSSMEATDIAPTRIEGAKTQIENFIQGRNFDRVGLVVFAADAFHYVPPTLDYDVLTERLGDVEIITDYNLENGTAIGTGIVSAVNMLRVSEASSRIIIMLTDGSNNKGNINPLDAARAAESLGVRIYTIGMGRETSVALTSDTGVVQQTSSDEFDEGTLQEIAAITDGLYFRAEDNAGLQRTYEQIDALERSEIERQVFVR
ncbi:MAG: VWA domain-containing protein, partial [Chloroflexota bacterium]